MRRPAALPAMLLAGASIAAACIAAMLPGPAAAETATASAKAAKPAKASAKAATSRKPAKAEEAPRPEVLAAASPEQMEAADRAYFGDYACEFDQTLQVQRDEKAPGYVDVRWNKQGWTMKPVLSSTGALRLEDVRGKALMIQIANKSMLMDQVAGRRLVDECVHETQRAARAAMALAPAESIGIDPSRAAAAAPGATTAATAATAPATATATAR